MVDRKICTTNKKLERRIQLP